jgi:glycosyltransferase involved in cell wall biosynthesis
MSDTSVREGCPTLGDLPPPPKGKTGWPWDEQSDSQLASKRGEADLPTISIVTPSYNQGRFIEETIRSVVLQGYPNLEYIVIDGGSTDETVDILEKYNPWITYWVSEPDDGQTDAINRGINNCTGDIFNWINSDDYLAKNALDGIVDGFSGDVDIVYGYNRRFDNKSGSRVEDVRLDLCDTPECSVPYHYFIQPSTYFRMDVVEEIGELDESMQYNMDKEWFLRYILRYGQEKINFIDELVSLFRLHENSKTVSEQVKFGREKEKLFRDLYESTLKILKSGNSYKNTSPNKNKNWIPTGVNVRRTVGALDLYLAHKSKKDGRLTYDTIFHLMKSIYRYPKIWNIKRGHIFGAILFPNLYSWLKSD